MSRIGETWVTIRAVRELAAVEQWRAEVRFLYGNDAERIFQRAAELSLTTALSPWDARQQATQEMQDEYARRIRGLAEGSE